MSINGFTARPSSFSSTRSLFKNRETRKLVNRNYSLMVLEEFQYVIEKQLNIVIDLYGLAGSGKSEVAFALWFHWQKKNKKLLDREVKLFITFNRSQTVQAVKKAQTGDMIIQDEDSRLSGHGSKSAIDAMNNIIDLIRETQISFIFVSPHPKTTLALANLRIEQLLKNYQTKQNFALVRNNADKLLGHLVISLHDNNPFRQDYQAKKTDNLERVKAQQGRDSVKIDPQQLEEDALKILDASVEHGISIDSKGDVELLSALKGIAGNVYYTKNLTQFIMKKYQYDSFSPHIDTSVSFNPATLTHLKVLRDLFYAFFKNKFRLPDPYSRIATSVMLWEKQLFTRKKKKIEPASVTLDQLQRTDIARLWNDTVSSQSTYQGISTYAEQLGAVWEKLTTHDLEEIGELYAYKVLKAKLAIFPEIANLNPSAFADQKSFLPFLRTYQSLILERQTRDKFSLGEDQKPLDLALFDHSQVDLPTPERVASVVFNHKLLTVKRSSSEKRFGESETPALKVLWKTTTRPFTEDLAIICSPEEQKSLQRNYQKVVKPLLANKEELLAALAVIHEKDQPMKQLLEQLLEKMSQGVGAEKKTNNQAEKKAAKYSGGKITTGENTGGLGFQSLTFEQLLGVIVGFVEKTKE